MKKVHVLIEKSMENQETVGPEMKRNNGDNMQMKHLASSESLLCFHGSKNSHTGLTLGSKVLQQQCSNMFPVPSLDSTRVLWCVHLLAGQLVYM